MDKEVDDHISQTTPSYMIKEEQGVKLNKKGNAVASPEDLKGQIPLTIDGKKPHVYFVQMYFKNLSKRTGVPD